MDSDQDFARQQAEHAERLTRHRARLLPFRVIAARPRLFCAFAAGALAGFMTPDAYSVVTRALIGWNVAAVCELVFVLVMTQQSNHRRIRFDAQFLDDGRYFVLGFSAIAAMAAIFAIVVEMGAAKEMQGLARALHLGLAACTILTSWMFMHMTFALHYAHEYYLERSLTGAEGGETSGEPVDFDGDGDIDEDDLCKAAEASSDTRGGLIFPDTTRPIYADFAYFSYTIGVASQTADVSISSRAMRKVVLAHSVLSFFFNTTILALTINLAAGLF